MAHQDGVVDAVLLGTNLALPASNSAEKRSGAADVHLLPCAIAYDGPARVSDYFLPREVTLGESQGTGLEATLRGRLLRGKRISLPTGVEGFVLRQDNLKISGGADQQAQNYGSAAGTFDELTYWNHDVYPSQRDYVPQAMRWFEVARKIHAPLPLDGGEEDDKQVGGTSANVPTSAAP